MASPIEAPTITASAVGVSTTRSAPKRCCRPSVARNTPPDLPTSSPSTITRSSRSISSPRAEQIASTMLNVGHRRAPSLEQLGPLGGEARRILGPDVVEQQRRVGRPDRRHLGDGAVDLRGAPGRGCVFGGVVPAPGGAHPGAEADQRVAGLPAFLLGGIDVARRVVGGGVGAEAIGHRLDQRRARLRRRPVPARRRSPGTSPAGRCRRRGRRRCRSRRPGRRSPRRSASTPESRSPTGCSGR